MDSRKINMVVLAVCALLSAACTINSTTTTTNAPEAYRPENDPAYVSPLQYEGYSCNQLHTAMDLVSQKIDQSVRNDQRQDDTEHALDTALAAYALAQGQGYNPPARHEHHHETVDMRRMKNEYAVIEQMAIKKNCISVN
jgi:hypothetical protein